MYHSTCNKYTAFQSILRFTVDVPGDGGEQVVGRFYRLVSRIHDHKTTGSICVFDHTRLDASLSKQGRLLVSCNSSDRHICAKDRKSTRLNSSHVAISYAVFCLKK